MPEWKVELISPKNACVERRISTRLIRKGALLEETHRVFLEWNLSKSFADNLDYARDHNVPAAANQGWLKEVISTISSRWRSESRLNAIVHLAKKATLEIWRPCVLWHIGQNDELYYRFATEWLFDEYQDGTFRIRTIDVKPFVQTITESRAAGNQGLSTYGITRAARDLLRMATAFGLLKGSAVREFCSYHLPEEGFLYLLHAMYEVHGNARDVIHSADWRLYLMNPADVERELFRLHQFRKIRFEVAGSLMELTLPHDSAAAYVKGMVV